MLKTAEPMTPDIPISSLAKKTPMITADKIFTFNIEKQNADYKVGLLASSGALLPAAINVAPATSGESLSSA